MASVAMASHNPLRPLQQARKIIDECLPDDEPNYELSSDDLDIKLHEAFSALSAIIRAHPRIELSCEEKGDVCHMILKLWNWCADDQRSSTEAPQCLAAIRKQTSDLLEALHVDELSSEERSSMLAIYHKMGAAHAKAGEQEAAEAAYSNAQELCVRIMTDLKGTGVSEAQRIGIMKGCMALILDRLTNAWRLHQVALASDLLSQATELLQQATLTSQQRFQTRRQDILRSLGKGKESQSTREIDAQSLLAYSHQLVTRHLDKEGDGSEGFQRTVTSLQAQVLRLLSQAYLLSGQAAHAYACVQSVRELQDPSDNPPSLCLTAIEALIQLERPEQAGAELQALVSHEDCSADLCLDALSAVIQGSCCSALKPAADIVLERFAGDGTAPQHKVLRLLSQVYLLSGEASQALACIEKARKLQSPPDDAPGLCLTAIEAHIQLEQAEEVEEQLFELLVDKSASADQCLAGLSAVIQGPCCSVPKAAAQYVLERFDDNAAVCLRVYQALLGTSEKDKNISREREAALMKLLRYKQIPLLFKKEDDFTKNLRKTLCMQLWDHAVHLYNNREYRASANFYIAAMHSTDQSSATWAALDKECRRINRAMPEVFRDREKFDLASDADPVSDPRISDMKARKALDRLLPLLKSKDPSLDFWAAVTKEMLLACDNAAMKQTLTWLWEEAIAALGPCKRPGDEVRIVVNLIEMSAEMEEGYELETHYLKSIPAGAEYQCSRLRASSDGSSNQSSIHRELARLFSQALHRMEAVGVDNFCGGPAPWFAAASYNAARTAMDAKDPAAAAVLFRTSGSFNESLNMTTPAFWMILRETYMLGIRCTMDEYARHPERKSCLTEAHALHKKASAALEAAALPENSKDYVKFRKALWNVELDLAMKEGRSAQMVPLVERAITERLFTAEELLQAGRVCMEIPDIPHAPSAKAAFSAALQLMRSQMEPPPRMDKLAETVNELYKVSSDEEALALLADVGAYVRSMETPAYPSSEMSWLITTAWDTGCKHAQHGHHAQALAFLAAAIELMDYCDAFKDTKEGFKKLYRQLTKDHSEAGAPSTRGIQQHANSDKKCVV